MFYDLNIKCRSNREVDRQLFLCRLLELGWDQVAWTTAVNKMGNQVKPANSLPVDVKSLRICSQQRSLVSADSKPAGIRQYSRLLLTVDEVVDAQCLTSSNPQLKVFDIVSVCPGNQKVFNYLCKTAEIDVICFDFTHRLPFNIDKKMLDLAVKRGIHFEIPYAQLIVGSSGIRKEIMSSTSNLLTYLKGRNLILASGAEMLGQVRGPMDVMVAVALTLGITKQQAQKCVSDNGKMMLQHAEARKLKFLPVEVLPGMAQVQEKIRREKLGDAGAAQVLQTHPCEDSGIASDSDENSSDSSSDSSGDDDGNLGFGGCGNLSFTKSDGSDSNDVMKFSLDVSEDKDESIRKSKKQKVAPKAKAGGFTHSLSSSQLTSVNRSKNSVGVNNTGKRKRK